MACCQLKPLPDESLASFLQRNSILIGAKLHELDIIRRSPTTQFLELNNGTQDTRALWGSAVLAHLTCRERRSLSYYPLIRHYDNPRWGLPQYWTKQIKEKPSYCPICAEEDIARHGFAQWRKLHQLRWVRVCPTHEIVLVNQCWKCGQAVNGMPHFTCSRCGTDLRCKQHPDSENSLIKAWIRAAKITRLVFFKPNSGCLDIERMGLLIDESVPRRTRARFQNVARELNSVYGAEHLTRVGLSMSGERTFSWPAKYLNRRWHRREPAMEILLSSHFCSSSELIDYWDHKPSPTFKFKAVYLNSMSLSSLKTVYRSPSHEDAARTLGVSSKLLDLVIGQYPGYRERIKAYRRRQQC